MRRAAVLCAFLLTAATASAQSYNPHAGDSVAPSPGTVVVPTTPNGVDWLNSMLGLSPAFLGKDGKVASTYMDISGALSSYVTQTALNTALDAYVTQTALTTTLGGYVAKGADLSDNTIGGSRVGDLITVQGNLVTLNAVSALLSSGAYYKAIQGGCLTPAGTVTTGGSCINSNYFVNAYYPQSGSFGSYVFAFTNASEFQGSFTLTFDAAKYTMPVYAPSATFSSMAGTGNAYACVNASGQVYRSSTACN